MESCQRAPTLLPIATPIEQIDKYVEVINHEKWRPEKSKVKDVANQKWYETFSGRNLNANALLEAADHKVQALLDEYWKKY